MTVGQTAYVWGNPGDRSQAKPLNYRVIFATLAPCGAAHRTRLPLMASCAKRAPSLVRSPVTGVWRSMPRMAPRRTPEIRLSAITADFATVVMERVGERAFVKSGAEGIYCGALSDQGLWIAL